MKSISNISFISRTPSWISSLVTSIIAAFILFIYLLLYGFLSFASPEDEILGSTIIPFTLYYLIIFILGFYIVKRNPKSVWYVPINLNLIGIIFSLFESSFWKDPKIWIPLCVGWLLTILVVIIGAWIGKKSSITEISNVG